MTHDPAEVCAMVGHQVAGPRSDGWLFCARCGRALSRVAHPDRKKGDRR